MVRSLAAIALVFLLVLGHAGSALAARGGGRIGGGSFRAPVRTAPRIPSGGGYYGGGGGGFFFLPLFFGGGSGLFGLILFVVLAGAAVQVFRSFAGYEESTGGVPSNVAIAKVQVGLLASARHLQRDLTRLGLEADTGSNRGLALVLREATVSLLRHPEYWVYASSSSEVAPLGRAEQKFNALAMAERSKLNAEVLSNVNRRLSGATARGELPAGGTSGELEAPSEYIIVTLLVAANSSSLKNLPTVRSANDLRGALAALGSVPDDDLLALEVLWEPQSEEYTLSGEEAIAIYPDLVRL